MNNLNDELKNNEAASDVNAAENNTENVEAEIAENPTDVSDEAMPLNNESAETFSEVLPEETPAKNEKIESETKPEENTEQTPYASQIPAEIPQYAPVEVSYDFSKNGNLQNGKKSAYKILIVILLTLIFAAVTVATVYCVIADLNDADPDNIVVTEESNDSNKDKNKSKDNNTNVILNTESKPKPNFSEDDEFYVDENGRYTVAGVAEVVRPQIVEIFVYESENDLYVMTGGSGPIGSGSGIIISEDGYIVTNTHVIDGGSYLSVTTSDDRYFDAEVIGRDAKTDIAVIKIEAKNLPGATLGDSDEVVLGEQVVAIGNPAGLTGSVTDGIISGVDRKIKTDMTGYEMSCLQTNAAISSGNSGGALVNMYGQVIGITSSKYIDYINMSYEGLGFAITINEAKPIIEELISNGYVSGRVRIGISFLATSDPYTAEYYNSERGAEIPEELMNSILITEISDECDISNSKLMVNDFMLKLNGKPTTCYDDVNAAIEGCKGGDLLTAECARIEKNGSVTYFEIDFELMSDTSGDF